MKFKKFDKKNKGFVLEKDFISIINEFSENPK
jgi:hypothetical protein